MKLPRLVTLALSALMAAAVVTLLVTTPAVPGHGPPSPCPSRWDGDRFGGWVPETSRLAGVDDVLVPGSPVEVLFCAYSGENVEARRPLTGSRPVAGADRIARDLSFLAATPDSALSVCTAIGGRATSYLLRFTYGDGAVVWVGSADEPTSCATTTNGTVTSLVYIGESLTEAYDSGGWELPRADSACDSGGRRGQHERLVPEGATSVVVCRRVADTWTGSRYGEAEARRLAGLLNASPAYPGEPGGCIGPPGLFRVAFGYPEGPPASVTVRGGCAFTALLVAEVGEPVWREVRLLASHG
ncbi:hypothetical protein [Nonomuraea soli]|uniref:Serine/threonine protein kinase n=1 Tax=Nonomuraea soli TaxID=1032476 RepID=A0A7W0CHM4_9ACTN|nr:hypothetical protein [Nonomuraea soli]MBA2891152.1 hypothetical protein [Nonomuraea soli]